MNLRWMIAVAVWGVALAVFVGVVLGTAPLLPETVVGHFDAAGQPDRWTAREDYVRLFLLLGLLMGGVIPALVYGARFLPPRFLNTPNAAYWRQPANYRVACDLMFRWSFGHAGILMFWLAGLHVQIVAAHRTEPARLNPTLLWLSVAGLILVSLVPILLLVRRFRRGY